VEQRGSTLSTPFLSNTIRAKTIKAHLVEWGRKFASLMGVHHRQYRGDAFYLRKGQSIKAPVNSRVMIDTVCFQEANPNYTRPRISKSGRQGSSDIAGILFWAMSVRRTDPIK
jgi:hypothetical protein